MPIKPTKLILDLQNSECYSFAEEADSGLNPIYWNDARKLTMI